MDFYKFCVFIIGFLASCIIFALSITHLYNLSDKDKQSIALKMNDRHHHSNKGPNLMDCLIPKKPRLQLHRSDHRLKKKNLLDQSTNKEATNWNCNENFNVSQRSEKYKYANKSNFPDSIRLCKKGKVDIINCFYGEFLSYSIKFERGKGKYNAPDQMLCYCLRRNSRAMVYQPLVSTLKSSSEYYPQKLLQFNQYEYKVDEVFSFKIYSKRIFNGNIENVLPANMSKAIRLISDYWLKKSLGQRRCDFYEKVFIKILEVFEDCLIEKVMQNTGYVFSDNLKLGNSIFTYLLYECNISIEIVENFVNEDIPAYKRYTIGIQVTNNNLKP